MLKAFFCRLQTMLSPRRRKVVQAWQAAQTDLGIEITPCYTYKNAGGKRQCALLWIKHVGSPKGTLVNLTTDPPKTVKKIFMQENNYFISALNPAAYGKYHRELFIDTLIDWGWFGPSEQTPDWMPSIKN